MMKLWHTEYFSISDNRGAHIEVLCVKRIPRSKDQIVDGQIGSKETKKIAKLKDSCTVCNKSH